MSRDRTIAKIRTTPHFQRCEALLDHLGVAFAVVGKGADGGNAKHPKLALQIGPNPPVMFPVPCSPRMRGAGAANTEANLRRLLRQHGVIVP